ncbi:hypothetical protein [Gimesia fumaroli]|uniref:Uncharacterized protein n=1 Tax=Gimesia fumaroli TaxID=2527976 RepID=A0A518ILH7_9PLAN|nr:hypothetical protein [Gimesia fumaroli]QDV53937.1 hypothetical protein Enr17x_60200 [Gimesia fumaroli]
MSQKQEKTKYYYFIDVDLRTRQIIGWGSESRDEVEIYMTKGFHRIFMSKGQYNKLIKALEEY